MDNRKLLALSRELQGQSDAQVDAVLREKHLDPQERLALKIELSAAATGRAMQATGAQPSGPFAPATELGRLCRRLGLVDGTTIPLAELEARMTAQGLTAEQRIAVKVEAANRGLLATARPSANDAERLLESLGIRGPVSLEAIERTMDARGWGVTYKHVVKAELQSRGWLTGGGNRRLRASSDVLRGRDGRPLTLKSYPA